MFIRNSTTHAQDEYADRSRSRCMVYMKRLSQNRNLSIDRITLHNSLEKEMRAEEAGVLPEEAGVLPRVSRAYVEYWK